MCIIVGAVDQDSRIVVGPENRKDIPPKPIFKILDEAHEIAGVGTIFSDENNKPKLHMHAAIGRKDKTIAGCIRPDVNIWMIAEVILLEIKGSKAIRKKNESLGFELLEIEE